ncbi:MAG: hypothetical protein JW991_03375 [Candidatus Pacebacteria bacterium]|nr:hypothetical protein [Candidatus Paceibacterota bacterium]
MSPKSKNIAFETVEKQSEFIKSVLRKNELFMKLLNLLRDFGLPNWYVGGKGFAVAVLTKKGDIYPGVSYNSDTYTLTMHSEAVALVHAALHGETEIIAITGPNCHICKQLIYESSLRSGIDTVILIKEEEGIRQIPISKLMPYPWPEKPFV